MSLDKTSLLARAWCEQQACQTKDALDVLGTSQENPKHIHQNIFEESHHVVSECPQVMGGPGNLDLLYSLVKGLSAKSVIETGVAYGWSSLAILLALQENGGGRLMSSNLHYPRFDGDERFVGCAVPESLRPMWTVISKQDSEAIPEILRTMPEYDLVHYDSAKSYSGRMFAYPLLWNSLRVGGLFISDDIDDNLGFKHFCTMLKEKPVIVETPREGKPSKYVGIIKKRDNRKPRDLMF